MDGRLAVMMELEKALNKFEGANLYSAGLAFFSALGYPVKPLKIAINESMFRFVYIICKNRCVLSREESHAMESAANISWLFALHHDSNLWKGIRVAPVDDKPILSINYFCVEMVCSWRERSMMAVTLTKIISKVVNTSVVVLFKHANQLLLSSAHMTIGNDQSSLRTYLSDWYVIDPIQEEVLKALSEWYCGNFSNDSLDDFLIDSIYLTARPYFRNSQGYIYAGHHLNSQSLFSWRQGGKDFSDNRIIDRCFSESDRLILIRLDPRDFYGYDYVSMEECLEVLEDQDDWVITEMESLLDETAATPDDQDRFKQLAPNQTEHSGLDIDGIDEDIFSDPIKLLSYLETLEEKK